jgi:prepilin-type N-terminal cleavage/methylation domain-containing protein
MRAGTSSSERGFTLLEALVAMMIVAMIVLEYLGVRTRTLMDATEARNWRLAREIAEEKMSELQAGDRETRAESGILVPIEKYKDFAYKIAIGESAVTDLESEIASEGAGEDSTANERTEWQRNREQYRKASAAGMSWGDYQDKLETDDVQRRLEEEAPSSDEFEDVAVAVYFPRLDPDYEGQKDALLIKAHVSTLALSCLTPEQAETVAKSKGQSTASPLSANPGSEGGGK